jgi:hypothetical protein
MWDTLHATTGVWNEAKKLNSFHMQSETFSTFWNTVSWLWTTCWSHRVCRKNSYVFIFSVMSVFGPTSRDELWFASRFFFVSLRCVTYFLIRGFIESSTRSSVLQIQQQQGVPKSANKFHISTVVTVVLGLGNWLENCGKQKWSWGILFHRTWRHVLP